MLTTDLVVQQIGGNFHYLFSNVSDLKRSKSSPSLPFVFETPSAAGSRRSDGPGSGRRDSAKYSTKSGKK